MSKEFIANGFKTVMPEGWADRSVLTLISNEVAGGFASNIVILREDVSTEISVEDYAREQLYKISNELENFQILDERPSIVQGKPAYQTLFRFTSNFQTLQQAQTFVLNNQTILAFTCTARLEDFDKNIPPFREVLDNLNFDE